MDIFRFILVKKLFDSFPKNENGNIDINIFKSSFSPNNNYNIINGNKTTDEAYGEFLECLDIFIEYKRNLKNEKSKTELTYEEFCDYFGEISFEIQNDYIFSKYINNCWEINIKH